MSIAQARASRVRPHYILVALLLGVVAAIAFGTLAIQAGTGDTQVQQKGSTVGDFNGTAETADPILSDGSVDLNVQADAVPDGRTEAGILTTSAGALGSVDGPRTMIVSWTNPTGPDDDDGPKPITVESKYFPDGFIGTALITVDNITAAGGSNATLSVASHAAPLDIEVVFESAADPPVPLDRIGVSSCEDCRYNGANITVTVKDAEGSPVSGVDVKLTLDSLTQGRFEGAGDNDTDSSVSAITVMGAVSFAVAADGVFQASDTPGMATFRGTLLGTSFEAELLVTGAPVELVLATSRVDRSSKKLDDVTDLGAELFSVGLTDSVEDAVEDDENTADEDESEDRVGTDVFIVYVTALDADGNEVDVDATPLPMVKDVTDGVDKEILFTGGNARAVAGFGVDDDETEADAADGDAVDGDPAEGVANGLGDAKTDAGDADLGSHDLQATWKPMGGVDDDVLTSNTVSVIVADKATEGDVGVSVETLSPGQVATIDVLFTDADGNIAPDGTPTRIFAANQTFASTGRNTVDGTTSNGRVSATLLPSGSDAVVTILAQAGEALGATPPEATATATAQVNQSSGAAASVASAIVVTADSTELTVGGSTRVSATVTDADGAAVAGALVRFSIDSREKVTDADGSVSAEFMATEAGTFSVTATVVQVRGGLDETVDTAAQRLGDDHCE